MLVIIVFFKEHGWWSNQYGYGILNAYNALSAISDLDLTGVVSGTHTYNVSGLANIVNCEIRANSRIEIRAPKVYIEEDFYINKNDSKFTLFDNLNTPLPVVENWDLYPTHSGIYPGVPMRDSL